MSYMRTTRASRRKVKRARARLAELANVTPEVARLLEMLSYRRPAGGLTEAAFIRKYLHPIPGMQIGRAGNLHVTIGGPRPAVLWSVHTDTVHTVDGFTHPVIDAAGRITAPGEILGADDGAGMYLALRMIEAQRPGLYIFHRGEEVGGIGSSYIANHTPELLDGIAAAIALDRMGAKDVITHMGGLRTCSNDFAASLITALGLPGMAPCSGGVFTDTANYGGLIPECTNLAVGYSRAHSKHEALDTVHLFALAEALCALDPDALDCPGFDPDPVPDYASKWALQAWHKDDPADRWRDHATFGAWQGWDDYPDDLDAAPLRGSPRPPDWLVDLIRRDPHRAAQVLMDYGLEDEIT